MHEKQLKPHLQCGTDPTMIRAYPTMIRPHTRPSRTRRTAEVDHRGSGTDFVWKNIGFRASAISQKRISCETSCKTPSQNSIGNSQWNSIQLIHQHHLQPHLQCGNDPTVANHNGILSTTHARKTVETPFTMRNRSENDPRISENDPTTHETVSHPSHRRGRSSRFGDGLCMEKHRLSCICYLSKTHFVRDFLQNSIGNSSTSTTCNPIYSEGTILELQITMEFHRQLIHQHHLQPHLQCGNDPTVANHNGILSTTHARKTVETPFTMRNRSENDPTMIRDHDDPTTHETVSHPSHRRGRSSRFGDGLCMEKHRLSCICYLSKTHFVRDFLQNSIGNSSTSTTCNPIYSEGTILELQITMEFHRQLIHQHHLQPHLQCGNDPTVANHNGILSTTHARKTVETPFTMRNRSENDPRMIRDHDPTTHETVSHPSHRRGRSSTFGDGLCMEKHRLSCICYLSKTHFVRDFLQNSIGNSSTSTTCNPIYSEGTISLLTLSVTNSFPH